MRARNAPPRRRGLRLPSRRTRFIFYGVGITLLLIFNIWAANNALRPNRARVPYSPFFIHPIRVGNVESIISTGTAIQGRLKRPVEVAPGDTKALDFTTEIPTFADTTQLDRLLESHNVSVNATPLQRQAPLWERMVAGVVPTLLFLLLLFWLFRKMTSGGGGIAGGLGRSRAERYEPSETSITFAEVAGIDEAKAELTEIVDFLKNPERYHRLGGRIPRGVLLSGGPGTGKTLLARAVAGEAGVPFFSLSASEFVEAVVGIGASRVRDLFKKAKEAAPAIVFIDELDAIGRARTGGGFGAGSEEREQTLNQILTEMDGFTPATDLIVIAATNRPDVLDKALLRPGRFDRRIAVSAPDRVGRRLILDVHTRDVPLAADVDLDEIAIRTPGMAGADLANLVNEAALGAARRGDQEVEFDDFTAALDKILLGSERKVMLTEDDRRRTAYHEAGHALAGMLIPGAYPVRKVTIIPRGASLGVTLSVPDTDRFNYTDHELSARLRVLLAGRAAEQLVFGELTSGAESDLDQLTTIARYMVGRWGMSPSVGMMAVLDSDSRGNASPETLGLLDSEVRRIGGEAYRDIMALLQEERDRLDALAEALLVHETLDAEDAYAAVGLVRPVVEDPHPPLTVQDTVSLEDG
jgi:cell division protease FtsH